VNTRKIGGNTTRLPQEQTIYTYYGSLYVIYKLGQNSMLRAELGRYFLFGDCGFESAEVALFVGAMRCDGGVREGMSKVMAHLRESTILTLKENDLRISTLR
jgi:hypothetical protein